MATFYFVRHGEMDVKKINTKIYQGFGVNSLTLSPLGVEQIKTTAKDNRLKGADLIITSPFGRAMHTASILSKELDVDMVVETDLHEWLADKDYRWIEDNAAMKSFMEFAQKRGVRDETCKYNWETPESIVKRVSAVLEKYKKLNNQYCFCTEKAISHLKRL